MDALFAYFLLRERKYVPPRHQRVQYNIRDLWQINKSGNRQQEPFTIKGKNKKGDHPFLNTLLNTPASTLSKNTRINSTDAVANAT